MSTELVTQYADLSNLVSPAIKVGHQALLTQQQIYHPGVAFLMIDLQERFMPVIHEADMLIKMNLKFLQLCAIFKIPIIYTEQYPQGLGKTLKELQEQLAICEEAGCPILTYSKTRMSVLNNDLRNFLQEHEINQLVVGGIEAHICVYQSCRDLVAEGYTLFLPEDMVSSRQLWHKERALQLLDKLGVTVTAMEIILFDLLKDAKSPHFKECQNLIK